MRQPSPQRSREPTSLPSPVGGTSGASATYRPDLEGLRGFAITLVVVYHVWFGGVSGGVDVFLALSGYFFVASLLKGVRTGTLSSPVPTLTRLARRLLPPLLVVLAATSAATALLVPPTRWASYTDQALASLFYTQNWELASTVGDYFAADPSTSPLQHLWSMSVQGQFFLGALALVVVTAWATRRILVGRLPQKDKRIPLWSARTVVAVLVAVTVASFLHAAHGVRDLDHSVYYNTFSRAWELLVGGLLAVALPHFAGRLTVPVRWALAAGGLAMIGASGFLLDGLRDFPGPWALVPVGGALAVIAAGAAAPQRVSQPRATALLVVGPPRRAPSVQPLRLLSQRPVVWLGKVAYSFYLWHWPVLIFYLVVRDKHSASVLGGVAVITVSLVLAWATERWVETPLRRPAAPTVALWARARLRLPTTYLTVAVVAAFAATVAFAGGWKYYLEHRERTPPAALVDPELYPGARELTDGWSAEPRDPLPFILDAALDLPASTWDGCIAPFEVDEVITCVYGAPDAARVIALAGGSHSEHWITALHELGLEQGFAIKTYLKMGCPLSSDPAPMNGDFPYPGCAQWASDALEGLLELAPDFVFTTSTRPVFGAPGDSVPEEYVEVWSRLGAGGIPILAIRDTPWLYDNPVDCLSDGGSAQECGIPRAEVLSPENPAESIAAERAYLYSLDVSDGVCDPVFCNAVQGNVVVYHDWHHLSATYVRSLVPELRRQLGHATQWW